MAFIMIQPTPSSEVVTHGPQNVSIANIEQGLNDLWAQFNKNIKRGQTVMRACMSNLIIYCDTSEEAEVISQELTTIVDAHPARILLLVAKGLLNNNKLDAFVSIYYTDVKDGLQVCAERIDVIANSDVSSRLPSVARSQLVGDLPTALWWASRQTPPDAGDVFFELADLADHIIYDNMGWINPTKGIAIMTRWVASQQNEQVVYNLAWRRTAIWRKLISQILDPRVLPDALSTLRVIKIDHGPHALAMSWLLISWLASQLNWTPVSGKTISNSEMIWQFQNKAQKVKVIARRLPKGEPLVYKLLFNWSKNGETEHIGFERLDGERIGIVETLSSDAPRVFAAQIPNRASLVSAQLAHRDRDKMLENTLIIANQMADFF